MDEVVNVSERWVNYLSNSSHNEIRRIIKDNINAMCANYISIGYCLKKVNDRCLYLEDGYSGIGDYAEKEFGIKSSKASKLISIIETLSVNGNSPVLREEYREFSIAKLEEIIYLDELQRKEISPDMSKNEIRNVKSKNKVSPAKVEVEDNHLGRVQGEIIPPKEVEDRKDNISSLGEQPIFCIDGGGTCSSYQNRNNCERDKSSCTEFTDLDGHKNSLSDQECVNDVVKSDIDTNKTENDMSSFENDIDSRKPPVGAVIYAVGGNGKISNYVVTSKHCNLSQNYFSVKDKSEVIHNLHVDSEHWHCLKEDAKKDSWYREDNKSLKEKESVIETTISVINEPEMLSTETKESDIPIPSHLELAKELLKQKQERLNSFNRVQANSYADRKYIESRKVEVGALAAYIHDLDETKPIEPVQPDLPKLKNNDQRKAFIDNYTSWPIWIDQNLTGERYYRYDLTDKVAMVVKANLKHAWENYKESKTLEYGTEQYYLVGINAEWTAKGSQFKEDSTRTFYECGTNKSALVEYLKEFQKGQVN